jgi:hypothetical protein
MENFQRHIVATNNQYLKIQFIKLKTRGQLRGRTRICEAL